MKSRLIWAAVLVAAAIGFYMVTIQPTRTHSPGFSRKRPPLRNLQPPELTPPKLPEPVIAMPTLTPPVLQPIATPAITDKRSPTPQAPEVPIQDSATIDFSTGGPQVRVQGADAEALDRALREMADATKGTSFPPKKTGNQ